MTTPGTANEPEAGTRSLVSIHVDGRTLRVPEGRTLAASLLELGIRTLRHAHSGTEPRGLFCAMGVCFECLVTVDGAPAQRACQVRVRDGMVVQLGVNC